ncbi:MAG: 30S ribosomal protein S6 [Deltaproteobacteria bacterium]|nr:30S ribosomal protein S6 [Deltaproteobacteria bacterium]
MNRDYETIIIFDSNLDNNAVGQEVDKIAALVGNHQGAVKTRHVVGRKRLAYKVKHKEYGVYVQLVLDGDNKLVADLDRQLSINESVLRHSIVKKDKHSPDGELVFLDDVSEVDDILANVTIAADDEETAEIADAELNA